MKSNEIIELISKVRPDINFNIESNLITEEKLDSFDIISILAILSEHYGIEIDPDLITEENFDSVDRIALLIDKLQLE